MVKCNLTPEEQAAELADFPMGNTNEDEDARRYFETYIFFDTWGRKNFREYFCPNCGRFEIEGPWARDAYVENPFSVHHGDLTNCPMCGEEGTLISLGRMRTFRSLRQWRKLGFFREKNGKLYLSAGIGCMEYDWNDLRPYPEYYETARYVVEPGKRQMWTRIVKYLGCGAYETVGWKTRKSFTEPFPRTHYEGMELKPGEVNFVNVGVIEKTSMKYCQLIELALELWSADLLETDGDPCPALRGVVRYLGEYSRRPMLEMLVKLGHTDVVQELLENGSIDRQLVDWTAKTPAAFFRLGKQEYRAYCEARADFGDLKDWYSGNYDAEITFDKYMQLTALFGKTLVTFMERCEQYDLDFQKTRRWLESQAPEGDDCKETCILWADYLEMATALGRNMTFRKNLLPDDLQAEHDAAAILRQNMLDEASRKSYGKRFRWLKKRYAFTDGEMSIVVPTGTDDIIREGKLLEHCVGGYAKRHIEGMTTILFLRYKDKIGVPYGTIEINDANMTIRQIHGFRDEADGDKNPKDVHKEFLDQWRAWLLRGSPRSRNGTPILPRKNEEEVKTA